MTVSDYLYNKFLSLFAGNSKAPIAITDTVFESIESASSATHPNEFLCFLKGESVSTLIETTTLEPHMLHADSQQLDEYNPYIITDFYLIPGTTSNTSSASANMQNMPINSNILGTAHSHPNGYPQPSSQDKQMFRKYPVNIILGHPYNKQNTKFYNNLAEEIDFQIITIDENIE